MATKAIQATGGDYATVALWEAYLEGIGTLAADEIGQINNEELTSSAGVTFQNITPGVFQVILEAQSGDSFRDNANKLTNALRYNSANGACWTHNSSAPLMTINIPNFTIRNLMLKKASNYGLALHYVDTANTGNTIDSCIIHSEQIDNSTIIMRALTVLNSLIIDNGNDVAGGRAALLGSAGASVVQNCTFVRTVGGTVRECFEQYSGTVSVVNCACFGFPVTEIGTLSGNNNGSDDAFGFGSSNQNNLVFADQFQNVTTGAMDFRLKTGAGLINNGTATGSPTPPTTDIIGQSRSGTPDIGCWEFQAAATGRRPTLTMLGIGA